jgi:hypothetical protein
MAELELEVSAEDLEFALQQQKQQLAITLARKQQVLKERKLWYFKPSPKQEEFFRQALKKRRAGFCGNRFGKSTMGVVEDCAWLLGYRPWYPEGHELRYAGIPRHGVKGLVISEDWDKVKEIFTNDESEDRLGKFIEYLPDDVIKKKAKNEKGIIVQITVESEVHGVKRESTVLFETVKAYKQNPRAFESGDYDFIHIDEPVPKQLWTAVSRGLIDRGGFSWWLLTPIEEVWMYSEHTANAAVLPELYWWFEATMDDNPLLSEEDKKLYLTQLPEAERDAREKGKPLAYAKLVLSWFDEEYHCGGKEGKWSFEPPADWKNGKPPFDWMVCAAIDLHPQTPNAALMIAVAPNGDIEVFDEVWERGTISMLAAAVKNRIWNCRVQYILCDPSAWNEDQLSGQPPYADTFYKLGLYVLPGSKQKELALMKTQELFKQRVRRVRIHKKCVALIKEIKNYYFGKDNKPVDDRDHLIECLRRLVIHQDLRYLPPTQTDDPMAFTNEPLLSMPSAERDFNGVQLNLTQI